MLRKNVLIVLLLLIIHSTALAHGTWEQHADDMYEILGLERNEKLTNWMRFVSSVLIDNNNTDSFFSDEGKPFDFYLYLKEKYPGFQCKHRLLFHWGYNSRPWSTYLQNKVIGYGWSDKMIKDFQADLIAEQKRRNSFANNYTENLFGFAHGGKEARVARVIISVVYDVHLLGDYEPDNTDLEGLQDIGAVVGDIINNINALDKRTGAQLTKQLQKISQNPNCEVQDKATALLGLLKEHFGFFLRTADNGAIKEHLKAQGFFFVDYGAKLPCYEKKTAQKGHADKITRNKSINIEGSIGVVIIISLIVLVVLLVILFNVSSMNSEKC